MTSAAVVCRQAEANATVITRFWRWLRNAFWMVVARQSEWDRICAPVAGSVDEVERTTRFRTTLALTKALAPACNVVFDAERFDVDVVMKQVLASARISEHLTVQTNLRACLQRCNYVNRVYARALALRDEPYDSTSSRHEALLEELWTSLKPDVRRAGGRITKEWGEIGFQGTDPMTDFRGMGILSLVQLIFFATKYPVEAQRALVESHHPTRWYPFSVTGINITGFITELINERLLDTKLYRHADPHRPDRDEPLVAGLDAIHEVYCTYFVRFNKLWVDTNPPDLMAFPTVFNTLKASIRKELLATAFRY